MGARRVVEPAHGCREDSIALEASSGSRVCYGATSHAIGYAYVDEGSDGDGKPVGKDIPCGEETSEKQDAGKGDAEGIQGRRVIELEEFNCGCDGSGDESDLYPALPAKQR